MSQISQGGSESGLQILFTDFDILRSGAHVSKEDFNLKMGQSSQINAQR